MPNMPKPTDKGQPPSLFPISLVNVLVYGRFVRSLAADFAPQSCAPARRTRSRKRSRARSAPADFLEAAPVASMDLLHCSQPAQADLSPDVNQLAIRWTAYSWMPASRIKPCNSMVVKRRLLWL